MAFTKITLATTKIKAGWTAFNTLIDDLLSIASGKGASQIGIEDSASNMAAANVEDALAEIYTDNTGSIAMEQVLDENSATTTGLTWGWKAGLVRFDNTIYTVAASTIALTDDATNYVEVNSSGSVVRNTTAFNSGAIPIRQITAASGIQTVSTDKRAWFVGGIEDPLPVTKGGTGLATITDHGIVLGSGTSDVTVLGVATNGQLPIGSTGADPVLATLTGTANEISVTNTAGTITLGLEDVISFVTNANGNPNISDTILDLDSNVTEDTWESVGPTDGGQDNTWTALDSVPSDANWIEVKSYINASAGATSTAVSTRIYARDDGSSESVALDNQINVTTSRMDGSGDGSSASITTMKIPISSRAFDVFWTTTFTNNTVEIILIGYGYNPS